MSSMNWRESRRQARQIINNFQRFLTEPNPLIREGLLDNVNLPGNIEKKLLRDSSMDIRTKLLKKPEYIQYLANDPSWRVKYSVINNNPFVPDDLLEILAKDQDARVREKAKELLKLRKEYDYVDWYQDGISVKLVLPGQCNADCVFCHNKFNGMQKAVKQREKRAFLENFAASLERIILKAEDKQAISLDITGQEPTSDPAFFIRVISALRSFRLRNKIFRTTLTTNGYMLQPVIPHLTGVVDYVNISIHHYRQEERNAIFGTQTPTDNKYKQLTLALLDEGINATICAVIDKQINDFAKFLDEFIAWAKDTGFVSLRFRRDVFTEHAQFLEYINQTMADKRFKVIQKAQSPEAAWCQLITRDGFMVYFFEGRADASTVDPGIEFVVHPDGKPYQDWAKKIPLEEYKLPVGYYFHKKTQF